MFPLLGKAKTTTLTLLKTLVGQGVCMGGGGGADFKAAGKSRITK